MDGKLRIHGFVFLLGALWLLVMPPAWIIGAILAVAVHECCHVLAILLCGGQIFSLTLHPWGALMETAPLTPGREALCALAGPTGSFLILLMAESFPEAALCGLIQGAYNLLPIYPLDGGRISRCLLSPPGFRALEVFFLTFFTGFSLWVMVMQLDWGLLFLLFLWIPVIRRKSSCKDSNLAVQ
jgi:Zn-dependent protease